MKKSDAILSALGMLNGDALLLCQLFEAAHGVGANTFPVPPHLVERLGEQCLLSWESDDDASYLDPEVIGVIRRIPWKKGEVPNLGPSLRREKAAKKKKK